MFKKAISAAAVLAFAMTTAAGATTTVTTGFNVHLNVQPFVQLVADTCVLNFTTINSANPQGSNPVAALEYTANQVAGQSPSLALSDGKAIAGFPTEYTLTGTASSNIALYSILTDNAAGTGATFNHNNQAFVNSNAQATAEAFSYNGNTTGALGLEGQLITPANSIAVDNYSDSVTATLYV